MHMYGLFHPLIKTDDIKTIVRIELNFSADKIDRNNYKSFSGNSKFLCQSDADFDVAYESIKQEIEVMQDWNLTIEINMTGILNNHDVTQQFKSLDAYHKFLENYFLMGISKRLDN